MARAPVCLLWRLLGDTSFLLASSLSIPTIPCLLQLTIPPFLLQASLPTPATAAAAALDSGSGRHHCNGPGKRLICSAVPCSTPSRNDAKVWLSVRSRLSWGRVFSYGKGKGKAEVHKIQGFGLGFFGALLMCVVALGRSKRARVC
jgi:hypothetical protein